MKRDREGPLNSRPALEDIALQIFGSKESRSFQRWIQYWAESRERNQELAKSFHRVLPLDGRGRRILDIGCGTGGLSELGWERSSLYVGADLHSHILRFARPYQNLTFLQANGIELPFGKDSFDLIFAFDVIEHLVAGETWQLKFLLEIRRVLTSFGMAFLTTPNFWYPYDAHTELYGPQFLPRFLRDRYIRWLNPGFLTEHGSFSNIQLISPRSLQRMIRKAGLALLHDLPCCLDRNDYVQLHPWLGWAAYSGLGWYPHAEFWMVLVHQNRREILRRKLRSKWSYVHTQSEASKVEGFESRIDFDEGSFSHQLIEGWHGHERGTPGYRWMAQEAQCVLETRHPVRYARVHGFAPEAVSLKIFLDGVWIGKHQAQAGNTFDLEYLVPFPETERRLFELKIKASHLIIPRRADDQRELSVMVYSMGLH